VEARGRDPRGEIPGGENVKRGSTGGHRVTPARRERTLRLHQSLEPPTDLREGRNGRRGSARREAWWLARRGIL
jgi:hypothetical protein